MGDISAPFGAEWGGEESLGCLGKLENLGKLVLLWSFLKLSKLPIFPKLPTHLIRTAQNSRTHLSSKGGSSNAAIKPKAIAVATEGAKGEG